MKLPLFAFAALCVLVGCADEIVSPAPTPFHQGAAAPPVATTTTYSVALGATSGVAAGVVAGYSITAIAPSTYRVYWTGDARVAGDGFREFYGSLWTPGRFTALTPGCAAAACPLEDGDWVSGVIRSADGDRIDWDTFASVGLDGLDVATDGAPVYLDVFVDGARRPDLAFLPSGDPPGRVISPAIAPFGIVAR